MLASLGESLLCSTIPVVAARGSRVEVVKPDDGVELHDIEVGRDFGTTMGISSRRSSSDGVVVDPADPLVTVQIVGCRRRVSTSPSPAMATR